MRAQSRTWRNLLIPEGAKQRNPETTKRP
jgi:hypothetical protein